jgi:hypothetical protein
MVWNRLKRNRWNLDLPENIRRIWFESVFVKELQNGKNAEFYEVHVFHCLLGLIFQYIIFVDKRKQKNLSI